MYLTAKRLPLLQETSNLLGCGMLALLRMSSNVMMAVLAMRHSQAPLKHTSWQNDGALGLAECERTAEQPVGSLWINLSYAACLLGYLAWVLRSRVATQPVRTTCKTRQHVAGGDSSQEACSPGCFRRAADHLLECLSCAFQSQHLCHVQFGQQVLL